MAGKTILKSLLAAAVLAAIVLSLGTEHVRTPTSAAGVGFVVDDRGDEPDANVGDGVCATAVDACTLRAALAEANANDDSNTITFFVVGTISPTTALPELSSGNVTIAGSDQQVTIDGSSLPPGTPCLRLTSDGNAVKGLVIAGCAGDGIQLAGGGNVIGGTVESERNVIRGCSGYGVAGGGSSVTGNQTQGNYIGVTEAGDEAAPNGGSGVALVSGASFNTVGGPDEGAGNVIFASTAPGITLMGQSSGNVVQGNYLGLQATGDFALPVPESMQLPEGMQVYEGASGNNILDNVIGAAYNNGISVGGLLYSISGSDTGLGDIPLDGTGTVGGAVWANWDAVDGTAPPSFFRASSTDGLEIHVYARDDGCGMVGPIWLTHVGSLEHVQIAPAVDGCPGPGAEIFFWSGPIGISPSEWAAADNVIQGNRIGTNLAGDTAIPNRTGVNVFGDSRHTVIGGINPGDGNLISGNRDAGIRVDGNSEDDVIQGNLVGVGADGIAPLPNGGNGVTLLSSSTVVGGGDPEARNVIAFNHANGVEIGGAAAISNTIRGNSIHSNWWTGILLRNGGNTELAAPVIASLGPITGTACVNCLVDIYSDSEEEGRIWEGWTGTDETGNFTYTEGVFGPEVTATATDSAGNTSQFSNRVLLPGVSIVQIDGANLPPDGETSVGLRALGVPPPGIGAFTIDIIYEPNVATPVDCEADPDGYFDTVLCDTSYGPGTVRVQGERSAEGATGDLPLANITFHILAPTCFWGPLMINVVDLSDTAPSPISPATKSGWLGVGIVGDADGSGLVGMTDAMVIAQAVVGLVPMTAIDQTMADVNCSGGVSMTDAMRVAQHVVFGGDFGCFPCP